jgi:hypothetical protein
VGATDLAFLAAANVTGRVFDGQHLAGPTVGDGLGDGMGRGRLQAGRPLDQLVAGSTVQGHRVGQAGSALGEGARLVEADDVDPGQSFDLRERKRRK